MIEAYFFMQIRQYPSIKTIKIPNSNSITSNCVHENALSATMLNNVSQLIFYTLSFRNIFYLRILRGRQDSFIFLNYPSCGRKFCQVFYNVEV